MVELVELALLAGLTTAVATAVTVSLLLLRQGQQRGPMLEKALLSVLSQNSHLLRGAFAASVKELGLMEDLGAIKTHARQIQDSSSSLQTLLQVKRGRAQLSEFQLEEILRDIFPPGKFLIRKRISGFGIPDAHIKTPEGVLCIDAKFPLDNYRRMVESREGEGAAAARAFASDVRRHIEKIAHDYVRPDEGGMPFAMGFIPSEAVFQYIAEAEGDLLREAASKGVNMVSPSTLVPSMNLLATSMRAREIGAKAAEIENGLASLQRLFDSLDTQWEKLRGHLTNAYSRMVDADNAYGMLRAGFRRVSTLDDAFSEGARKDEKEDAELHLLSTDNVTKTQK